LASGPHPASTPTILTHAGNVGQVLKTIDYAGFAHNTIVIYTTDRQLAAHYVWA
jgi:hypothetical protein